MSKLEYFAERYAEAWGSQDPEQVASYFAESGSLTVNNGVPAVGHEAIAEVAESFMTAFPDMVVTFDDLIHKPHCVEFHWTLIGTNSGPGGTGNRVRISGYEEWQLDEQGLIVKSRGHYSAEEYERQIAEGVDT